VLGTVTDVEAFSKSDKDKYRVIRNVLNIHELVAVGVRKDVLDKDVCFDFWCDELLDAFRKCASVIEHARKEPEGTRFTYINLEHLYKDWLRLHKKMIGE
jgi:hypothetical protein